MWSYTGNPSDSTRDKVRFLIGDTDTGDQQLQDEEIDAMLTDNADNAYTAAIACAEVLVARFSRYVTKSVGDLSISYGERVTNYKSLLGQLRMRSSIQSAAPYCGGISVSDKLTDEADTDRVAPAFSIGSMDYLSDTDASETS